MRAIVKIWGVINPFVNLKKDKVVFSEQVYMETHAWFSIHFVSSWTPEGLSYMSALRVLL